MTYPTRGAWLFRNVTRSFDFTPTLDTIEINQSHPSELATFSGSVVDLTASLTFEPEDRIRVTFAGARIFEGHIKAVGEGVLAEIGPRVYRLEAQDLTAKLDDSVIDHPADRPSETFAARVAWVLTFLNWSLTTTGVNAPGGTAEKANLDGMTVREALDQIADEARAFYYVDFGNDLHFFRTETVAAAFNLNDTTPNYSTSFPFTEYQRTRDSGELATAAYVQGETGIAWVSDAAAIATYGRQERTVNDGALKTAQAIVNAGTRTLAQQSSPAIEGSAVVWEPGLRAGMNPSLTMSRWGLSAVTVYLSSVTIYAVDPHDSNGTAYLRCEVTFTDRRRAKGSHRNATNKNTRKRDTSGDDAGDDAGSGAGPGTVSATALQSAWDSILGGQWTGLFTAGAPFVGSWVSQNTPYTVSGCSIGGGLWGPGGQTWEAWYTMTATGTDGSAFAEVTIGNLGTLLGRGDPGPYRVGWANAAPGRLGEFAVVGEITGVGGTVLVPGPLIIDGGTNYLVIAPAWGAIVGWSTCAENISSGFGGPVVGGEGNSGRGVAPSVGNISGATTTPVGPGRTSWVPAPAGSGAINGSNRTFTLAGWNGTGIPEARWGVAILGLGLDYEYDAGPNTLTFREAPPEGTLVGFRYRVDA